MAGASVESCRFVVLRSPWGRLGSELDMGSRLRRMRGCFDQWMQIKTGPQQCADKYHDPPKPQVSSANVAGGAFREARGYVPGPLL